MARSALGSLPQFVTASVTQGSADAFATTRIETGISTAARYAWLIDRVEFFYDLTTLAASVAAACSGEVQIVQGAVPTGLLSPTSADYVCGSRFVNRSDGTEANFQTIIPLRDEWVAPENFVVVDPAIHLSIDSTSTGQALVHIVRLWYWPVELSEMDILRMLALR